MNRCTTFFSVPFSWQRCRRFALCSDKTRALFMDPRARKICLRGGIHRDAFVAVFYSDYHPERSDQFNQQCVADHPHFQQLCRIESQCLQTIWHRKFVPRFVWDCCVCVFVRVSYRCIYVLGKCEMLSVDLCLDMYMWI
jgi:hypothetical protein